MKRVALITGGTRGIGRGITDVLFESGDYQGFLLVYNTNQEAAESYCKELKSRLEAGKDKDGSDGGGDVDENKLKIRLVGGDLSLQSTRDAIFDCFDSQFSGVDDDGNINEWHLSTVVHNAGQYVGITADNAHGITKPETTKKFGDGSLLIEDENGDRVDFRYMNFYHKLYGEAFIDICERSLKRMKEAREHCQKSGIPYRGSIIGISSPGVNSQYSMVPGYDMPGSGKCLMEYSIRHYAQSVAHLGINCNIIVPGVTRSDAWVRVAEIEGLNSQEEIYEKSKGIVPMGEVAEARDIGDVVEFLSGNRGGRFMTGLSLRVDGGLHLRLKRD